MNRQIKFIVPKFGINYAVIKMVKPTSDDKCHGWLTHQNRCTGKGFKPPKGAVFKRHGIERLGKGFVMSKVRYG